MSRDSNDLFPNSEDYIHFEIQSKERKYYLPTAKPSNEAKIMEKEATAFSRDGRSYFFADSRQCEVRSNDPNDLYRALDATFHKSPSIFSKLFSALFGIKRADQKAIDCYDTREKNSGSSKPKM